MLLFLGSSAVRYNIVLLEFTRSVLAASIRSAVVLNIRKLSRRNHEKKEIVKCPPAYALPLPCPKCKKSRREIPIRG
jgi:hypothetical protein